MKKTSENFQTLYRKYRPQKFSEILGQENIISALENNIKKNEVSHAYLFSGSRGTGKTTTARIFASELKISPSDIYEIDAASNRGIAEIREVRDSVSTLPVESEKKIYIIDEAHMLTKEASNAILKTLEEPPSHVLFILATTEKQRILPTILSRCQVFDFKKAEIKELVFLIKNISKKENREIDEKSALLIAKKGAGSFRDTLSYLQTIFSVFHKKIEYENFIKTFSISQNNLEDDFLKALNEESKENAFRIYENFITSGGRIGFFTEELLKKIRVKLLKGNDFGDDFYYKLNYTTEELQNLESLKNINSKHLKDFLELSESLKNSENPNLYFEIFLYKTFG